MNDDHWNDGLEEFREEYNAPPETPREAIWDRIEAALEQAPPEEILTTMREIYQRPPQTPRDEMWVAIEAELPAGREAVDIIAIDPARRSPTQRKSVGSRQWTMLATAAAALLVMGIGLGRLSVGPSGTLVEPAEVATPETAAAEGSTAEVATAEVPTAEVPTGQLPTAEVPTVEVPTADVATVEASTAELGPAGVGSGTMRMAAADHFSRTESLLTMVRSDARAGRVDAEVGEWARTLLLQTRLLMSSSALRDPMILGLVEDLEVVLMQVIRLSPGLDGSRSGELDLITESLEDNDIMLRIRAILPATSVQAGI